MLMLLVHSKHNCAYVEPHRDPTATGNTLSSLLPLTIFFCKAVGSPRVHLRSLSSALVVQTRLCWIRLFHTLLRSFYSLLFLFHPLEIFSSSYPSDHFHISFVLISFQPTQCYCHSEPHGGLKTKE